MSKAIITIDTTIAPGHLAGDYAQLFANTGLGGQIDFSSSVDGIDRPLFPRGEGIYGFALAPFGNHRFGSAHSTGSGGFGHLPFGHQPFGLATGRISATREVTECGNYKYAFVVYDSAGNADEGTPGQTSVDIHIDPEAPEGLAKNSYNKSTNVLTLDVI